VGRVVVRPYIVNAIAARVDLIVEFRHPQPAVLAELEAAIKDEVGRIAGRLRLEPRMEVLASVAPTRFHARPIAAVKAAAGRLGLPCAEMVSGAGHDACNLAKAAPTAMIFVPCRGGVSHVPEEDITPRWAEVGAQALMETMLELSG
jgi:N-carbamoyl-L-amino-acid hydrolase